MDRLLRNFRHPSHHHAYIANPEYISDPVALRAPPPTPTFFEDDICHRHAHRHDEGILSEIKCSKEKFEVNLDVEGFQPGDFNVRRRGKFVIIEGNHEEPQNAVSYTSRHFVRRYLLPDNAMPEEVQYKLTSNGILHVQVARRGGRMTE